MKLLVVSFAFPPVVAPRSIQVARLLRHLDAECAVVCGIDEREPLDSSIDPQIESLLPECVRIPLSRPKWRRRLDAAAARAHLPFWNKIPDQYRRWRRPALAAARRIIADGFRPDALVTFGNPMTDHLVGLALRREFGLPWVAHFSDPWIDNPFQPRDGLDRIVNERMQRSVFANADRLLFPSEECASYMLPAGAQELRARSGILPHSYEPGARSVAPGGDGELVIRHIGTLYGVRSAAPVIDGLTRLVAGNPGALEGMRLEFVGIRDRRRLVPPGTPDEVARRVFGRDRVSYRESLALMDSADGLLMLDGMWSGPGIFFPSKLADYIGSGRPILGMAAPGPGSRIIQELGGRVAGIGDVAGLAQSFQQFITLLRDRRRAGDTAWGKPDERARYAAPLVAAQFRELVAGALDRSARPKPLAGEAVKSYLAPDSHLGRETP